ncbi:Crp/Fnr family transcriptional regulator [Streptococcus gallolyticus]|nr:Crp/Fnr family transcriptional regulator [Streptococcus gallolyticus]MBY5041851.1 Crp/Fnr family transcriptional regulator [Streptococcus gallolyticus]
MMNDLRKIIQDTPNVAALLASCPLKILQAMDIVQYEKAGDFHLPRQEFHDFVYILVSGECEISIQESNNRTMILVYYDQAGALIGEQEAILQKPYSASVINRTPCQLLKISNQTFLEWIQMDHSFTHHLLKDQCQQIYNLANQASYLTLHNAKEQIARFLLACYKRDIIVNKQDVHRAVAMSTRHVNRILSDLVNQQIIDIHHSTVLIKNPKSLQFYGEE